MLLCISSAFANHELMQEEPEEPLLGQSPQTSVTMTCRRGEFSPIHLPRALPRHTMEGLAPPGQARRQDALPGSALTTTTLALKQTTVDLVYL